MKILGTTEKGFLVDMSDQELCHLVGVESAWNGVNSSESKTLIEKATGIKPPHDREKWVGLILPVSSFYQAARKTAIGWNQEYDLQRAISFLDSFKSDLQHLLGIYKPQTEEKSS